MPTLHPSRCYTSEDLCPHCGKIAREPASISQFGYVWHIRCLVQFDIEYGRWLARHASPANESEDHGDIAEASTAEKIEYHLNKWRKGRA
jgi:hypothetical protein